MLPMMMATNGAKHTPKIKSVAAIVICLSPLACVVSMVRDCHAVKILSPVNFAWLACTQVMAYGVFIYRPRKENKPRTGREQTALAFSMG